MKQPSFIHFTDDLTSNIDILSTFILPDFLDAEERLEFRSLVPANILTQVT